MKRTYFDPARMKFRTVMNMKPGRAPERVSRRFHIGGDNDGTCYLSGGDGNPSEGGEGEDPERTALLKEISDQTKAELEKRGYTSKTDVESVAKAEFATAFKDVDIEALRKYKGDKQAIELAVRNMAIELEKLQKTKAAAKEVRNALEEQLILPENRKLIEDVYKARKMGDEVVINIRALNQVMTTDNVVDNSAIDSDILNSFSVGAFVKKRQPREWIFDIASRRTVGELTQTKTWLEEGNVDGSFAIVAEGATKPYLSGALVRNTAEAKKVAGKYVITEELKKFMSDILNIVEDIIRDQILRDYNDLLTEDLLLQAASYTGTSLDGTFTNPTRYHAIGAVSAQIETLNFIPSVIIIHPQDKWAIALETDAEGRFFLNIPQFNPITGELNIMGLPVRTSTKVPIGTAIIGEAGLWKIEDEALTVRIGYGIEVVKDGANVTSVTSDFDNNRMRVIVETYFMDWIATPHIGSFVEFTFADVIAALTTP